MTLSIFVWCHLMCHSRNILNTVVKWLIFLEACFMLNFSLIVQHFIKKRFFLCKFFKSFVDFFCFFKVKAFLRFNFLFFVSIHLNQVRNFNYANSFNDLNLGLLKDGSSNKFFCWDLFLINLRVLIKQHRLRLDWVIPIESLQGLSLRKSVADLAQFLIFWFVIVSIIGYWLLCVIFLQNGVGVSFILLLNVQLIIVKVRAGWNWWNLDSLVETL